jgi:hypothetical protein
MPERSSRVKARLLIVAVHRAEIGEGISTGYGT